MSLADRYQGDRAKPSGDSSFTCPHYEPKLGSKRCRHYLEGGACARPDEFMCVEWLKANGHAVPPVGPLPSEPEPAAKSQTRPATDLFGRPLPEPEPARPSKAEPPTPTVRRPQPADQPEEREPLRGLTTEDIDSFKELGVEVCLRSEAFGEVWLVPKYTGRDRKEITPEHAATICQVLQAFPGSQVVSFEKSPQTDKEAEA